MIKAFFAGNVDDDYNNQLTKKIFKINTRKELFDEVSDKSLSVFKPGSLVDFFQQMYAGNLRDKIVLINTQIFNIPPSEYFAILMQVDFFIFMPGYIQPFCHNQIETMASGAIPITQFPNIFSPALIDGYNAIVFDSSEDLIDILEKINKFSQDEILNLRKNVIKYYIDNYSFKSICNKIENPKYDKICICAGDYSMKFMH